MLRHPHRSPGIAAALVAAVLAVSGCAANDRPEARQTSPATATQRAPTSPATATPTPTPTRTPTSPATGTPTARATIVTVTLTDFKITLSTTSLSPGPYTFVAEQRGQSPHALSIQGPGVETVTTPTIPPGGPSQRLNVTLQPGTYEMWCPVDNHRALGMEVTVTVQ